MDVLRQWEIDAKTSPNNSWKCVEELRMCVDETRGRDSRAKRFHDQIKILCIMKWSPDVEEYL